MDGPTAPDSRVIFSCGSVVRFLREQKIRFAYSAVSIGIVYIAYRCSRAVLSDQHRFDGFQYYGTVAGIVALLIALAEVWHSIHVTQSIASQLRSSLEKVFRIDLAAGLADCLGYLDQANNHVSRDDYVSALSLFQFVRRTIVRLDISATEKSAEVREAFTIIETSLQSATHSSAIAPFDRPKKAKLAKDIVRLKEHLESIAPRKER